MLPEALKGLFKLVGEPNPRFIRKGVSYDLNHLTKAQAEQLVQSGWKHLKKVKPKANKGLPPEFG
jgi:hypothetical protein